MTEPLSSVEATKRWKFLIGIENLKSSTEQKPTKRKRNLSTFLSSYSSNHGTSSGPVADPFDCSSLVVLSTHDLVENTIQHYAEEWKRLEDRKISPKQNEKESVASTGSAGDDSRKKRRNTNYGGGWRAVEDKLTLPDGFHYNQKSSDDDLKEYDAPVPETYQGDVVMSMKNPTQRLSYHGALSELFHSIPSCEELEEEARRGHRVENTLKVFQETFDSTRSFEMYTIARLRLPDRHGLPEPSSLEQRKERKILDSTMLFEFWRKHPRGCMTLGCHRMIAEFHPSQTLWDVHVLLCDMAEDQLWEGRCGDRNDSTANSNKAGDCEGGDREDTLQNLSGCFFIENIFYKTGSVDYAKPIIEWIDGGQTSDPECIRRGFLGLDASDFAKSTKAMKSTKLGQLPLRLNMRYFHACHGDVETTVMLIDRRMICQKQNDDQHKPISYPILHDVWMSPHSPAVPACEVCQNGQAVFKTSIDCNTTDGGPRSLCQECCQDLKLLKKERHAVKLYREWGDQAFLSSRADRDDSEGAKIAKRDG